MSTERYFYHSFPRDKKDGTGVTARGLKILEGMLDRGLLLTPEILKFQEHLSDGRQGLEWRTAQKRICFTELNPRELPEHAQTFGPFALEWDIDTLRSMGAMPTNYVPIHAPTGSIEGIGAAMLARVGEIHQILARLSSLRDVASAADPNELLNITQSGTPIATTRMTAGGAVDLLAFLTADTQPVSQLEAALKWAAGLVYPVDDPQYPGPLRYYRQREWKITGNIMQEGAAVTRILTADEIAMLMELDATFFGREIDLPTGRKRRVDACQLYDKFRGQPAVTSVKRIIVPAALLAEVTERVKSRRLVIECVALESLG